MMMVEQDRLMELAEGGVALNDNYDRPGNEVATRL
jgi:hypothetical protein